MPSCRYFDEEGNYVERKEQDPTAKDAWLTSDEAKVVSDEVSGPVLGRRGQSIEWVESEGVGA